MPFSSWMLFAKRLHIYIFYLRVSNYRLAYICNLLAQKHDENGIPIAESVGTYMSIPKICLLEVKLSIAIHYKISSRKQ